MSTLAEELGAWLASTEPADVPSAARETVRRLFLDVSGLCVAARRTENEHCQESVFHNLYSSTLPVAIQRSSGLNAMISTGRSMGKI